VIDPILERPLLVEVNETLDDVILLRDEIPSGIYWSIKSRIMYQHSHPEFLRRYMMEKIRYLFEED